MKKYISLFILLVLLAYNTHVFANGAPNALSAHNNGEIRPIKDESIEILNEKLEFSNFRKSGWYLTADADITYTLFNNSNENRNVEIVFPYDDPSPNKKIDIKYNKSPITYKIQENIDYFKNFNVIRKQSLYGYRNPNVIVFSVDFKPNEKSTLQLNYKQYSGFDKTSYFFLYYLQPAKYWKDFNDLDISIKLPKYYHLSSEFDFKKEKTGILTNTYGVKFEKLPDSDLNFTVYWDKVYKYTFYSIGIVIFLAVAILLILWKKRFNRN